MSGNKPTLNQNVPIIKIDTSNISSDSLSEDECPCYRSGLSDQISYPDSSLNQLDYLAQCDVSAQHLSADSWDATTMTSYSIYHKSEETYPDREMALRTLAIASSDIDNPFAFTAKQLQTFIDPKNILILQIIAGIEGLYLGLHTDPITGLRMDEEYITNRVTMKDLMSTGDYLIYEKMCKNYQIKNEPLKSKKQGGGKYDNYSFFEKKYRSFFDIFSILQEKSTSDKPSFLLKISIFFKCLFLYINNVFSTFFQILSSILGNILKIKFIRVLKEVLIGKSESTKDFINFYGNSFKTRISIFGVNRTPRRRVKGIIPLVLLIFRDPILILLVCATIVSFGIDAYHRYFAIHDKSVSDEMQNSGIDGIAILVAIVVISLVSAINDYQKEVQFEKLNAKKEDYEVRVIRSQKPVSISVYELQVGDILLFELGDLLPVDGVLIDGYNVYCDESGATGESNMIEKVSCSSSLSNTAKVMFDEQYDPFMISGSKILEGTGKYIVTSVGEHSYYEKIMASIQTESDDTPLQIKLNKFAIGISKFGIFTSFMLFNILFFFFLLYFLENEDSSYKKTMNFMRILISSITIVVVALPEGLPLAITLTLAYATRKMSKENNLVRHLKSCETMGNVTTICSDKTGTLTQNKMTLVIGTIGLSAQFLDYSNLESYENMVDGMICMDFSSFSRSLNPCVKQLILQSIAVNSTAFLSTDQQGQNVFVGSKTDCALLEFAQKYFGMNDPTVERERVDILQFIPFNSSRKYMATIISLPNGGARLYIKGASEILLEYSSFILDNPLSEDSDSFSISPLRQEDKNLICETITKYASMSLRTIALIYRDFDSWPMSSSQTLLNSSDFSFNDIFSEMVFIGVVGVMDPLREGVKDAINVCKKAGITVRMVTGDNKITAAAIARLCGIYTPGGILMEGIDFRNLSPEDMNIVVPRLQVLARSSPEDKRILVSKLKELGEVVAVTGDGTNDGPALKKADVGFSMGITGTDVAKEASDIILMDDNFASIVKACAWGRAIILAIRKFLQFQITVNLTAVLLTFVTAVVDSKQRPVFSPVQLLWVNLIMDTFAALALATDPPSSTILNHSPEPRTAPLITFSMWKMIVGQSIYQLFVTLLLHFFGNIIFKYDQGDASLSGTLPTLIFNTFVFMQIFNEFNCWRLNNDASVLEGIRSNPWYIFVNIIMILGQIIIIFFGNKAFHVKPLNTEQWIISIFLGGLSIPVSTLINCIPNEFLRKLLSIFIKDI
ncbi:hypothetical protein PCANB_000520 [Pneumocystis canis]|nr:hypothetical protein PCANB_000520 [Pneumocystis canis]